MQASCLGFSPALEKRAGGLSDCVRLSNHFGPQHSAAFPPEPGTGLRNYWCRERAQTPPFPCIPIPLLFTIVGKIQALSQGKGKNLPQINADITDLKPAVSTQPSALSKGKGKPQPRAAVPHEDRVG